jgi:hypothetical protein
MYLLFRVEEMRSVFLLPFLLAAAVGEGADLGNLASRRRSFNVQVT